MTYPPADDRLRHLFAQRINCHVDTWKLAFFIAGAIVGDPEIRAELDRVETTHAAGRPCGDRNCPACFSAATDAAPAVVSPPADRAALRDRIRRAVCEAEGFAWDTDMLESDEYGEAADAVLAELPATADELAAARATNQRLNYEKQRLESELAAYRRAVADWKISERGTYVPLRSLAVIAKAAGIAVPERWELHYERLARAEADRAAMLTEAAEALLALRDRLITEPEITGKYLSGMERAARELRRLAGEAAPGTEEPADGDRETSRPECPGCRRKVSGSS